MKFRSQVFTAVSGSIGGITYSHNSGGLYTRGRATPTNPNTAAQQQARNAVSAMSTRWNQTLTPAQRAGWETYAVNTPLTDVFGDPLQLSGQQMYVRCNQPRVRAFLQPVDDFPVVFGQADLSPVAAGFSSPDIAINWSNVDEWVNSNGGMLFIQTSHVVGPTINFLKGPFRFLQTVLGDDTTPPVAPTLISQDAFGMNLDDFPGQRLFLRVRSSNADARLSPVQILTVNL